MTGTDKEHGSMKLLKRLLYSVAVTLIFGWPILGELIALKATAREMIIVYTAMIIGSVFITG